MSRSSTIFTTIRTEGALLPADLLQRISEGKNVEGLRPEDYHRPGEKLNEAINRSWNVLQGAWANFKAAREILPAGDIGTTTTRERWLLPLFRELDYGRLQTAPAYEIDGRSYPVSHAWEHVPVHLVSYKVELDTRTPGVAGASTATPHSLMQVYLNRSDDALWGFLSNGNRLRILRDNLTLTRQAYVEFDLEAMMDGEVYSDFVLLWLLCHQSRVEGERPSDGWLEKWMKVAEQQGTRALDQLRVGVENAITAFGLGFIEHPANGALRDSLQNGDLSGQDYYRQLLRLVYRMLFLFVAEDRQIDGRSVLLDPKAPQDAADRYMKYYSTQRLRGMAETFKGTRHPDLFEGLRLVMRLLSGEENGKGAALGLVPLGSFLFSDGAVADLIDCKIANHHLLDAVRALSLTYDDRAKVYRSVDYRNLGPEELGSVYESLLELHPQINVPARRFALATAGGNERKTTGSYYTPSSLINALLDSALNPVLEEAAKKGEAAILDLKICDPACGSGHFLIAAAQRIAKKLAEIRTGEEEPTPTAVQEAKRDVIGRCIYGVDINPMAAELCKVNLWMEALEPGKPLSFLESHIRVGNSLLGTTPRLMAGGIPDDAFNPIEGDDKKIAASMKKANREARKQREAKVKQLGLFDQAQPPADYAALNRAAAELNTMDDDTLDDLRRKEAAYAALATGGEAHKARLLADAWCAAFVWEKGASNNILPLTDLTYRWLEDALRDGRPLTDDLVAVASEVERLRKRYQFFHWHVAFPDVFPVPDGVEQAENEQAGWDGGFACVLGNPPWERIKIEEKQWFAERAPEIANASNASSRRNAIALLSESNPDLLLAFANDKRVAEGESHFVRVSQRYPLTAQGDVNTYPLFAELGRQSITPQGYSGLIIPTGIATSDSLKQFFEDIVTSRSLKELIGFENEEFIFVDVANVVRFCILVIAGYDITFDEPIFAFYISRFSQLEDKNKFYKLSQIDIALMNPNTLTCATFRYSQDAEITKSVYRKVPILVHENSEFNPWGIGFIRMFDMTNDSHLFYESDLSESAPLYESKFISLFDHRYGSYEFVGELKGKGGRGLPYTPIEAYKNPFYNTLSRYWVSKHEILQRVSNWSHDWFYVFRNTARNVDERTTISSIIPLAGVGNNLPIITVDEGQTRHLPSLLANLNSFILDYVTRQKSGGASLNFFIIKQLPIIPPHTFIPLLIDVIVPRVLELTYTSWDLQPFAQDIGWQGPPFVWDNERRFLMRCELDALYFHLYQIERDDVDYIMDTFPIVKRKDEAAHGEFRTKRVILEMYDQMAALPTMAVPAPKDETATYLVPDVSQWQTWLSPGPADPSVAHTNDR